MQTLCPALPCRRGPGSGHPGKQPLQTGPPRLSLFTQHTGRLPCEQRGGECQGEGGSLLGPPLPAGACCGGPAPLQAGPRQGWRKTTQPLLSSQNSPPGPCSSLRCPGPPGAPTKGPRSASVPHLSPTPSLQGGLTATCPPGCGGGRCAGPQSGGVRLPSATTLQTGLTGSRPLPPLRPSW